MGSTDRTRRPFAIDDAVDILGRTPATLDALLRGLPDTWVTAHEGGETWSAFDVVGHLIYGERSVWMPRVTIILEHGEGLAFASAESTEAQGQTLDARLDEFARLRGDNLRALTARRLTAQDLERRGRHPALGVVALRQLLATWVAHDLDHVMQISRVLATQYADVVGPWHAYLRIISGTQG